MTAPRTGWVRWLGERYEIRDEDARGLQVWNRATGGRMFGFTALHVQRSVPRRDLVGTRYVASPLAMTYGGLQLIFVWGTLADVPVGTRRPAITRRAHA